MSELEITKNKIVQELHMLCAHCGNGLAHSCPLADIETRIKQIQGIPLMVNNEFKGVVWCN